MGSCFPGSLSLLSSPVVRKYSLRYLVFVKFFISYKKRLCYLPDFEAYLKAAYNSMEAYHNFLSL